MKRLWIVRLAALLAMASAASGYYHFVHFRTRTGPFTVVREKFNLLAVPNQTIPYFVAEQGPTQMAAGDSFASLVSQIRLAAATWSGVEGSAVRLGFSGLFTQGAPAPGPAIEIVFQELPPGVLALGGPSVKGEVIEGSDGPFVPIEKSTVVLPPDMSRTASWSEAFFLTLTHEFGHALGLQHSLTSSVMSTAITRATTKSIPLAHDDSVGLRMLYSPRGLAATGTIRGRVSSDAGPVNLASVVALSHDGTVVSSLTNPDGTYEITGIPSGSYFVYAHPLPPAVLGEAYNAGITPPLGPDGLYMTVSGSFDTQFYPGTKDPSAAQAIVLSPGLPMDGINFTVQRRAAPAVFGVQTFSFPGQVAVKPAHLSPEAARSFILAAGYGLTDRARVGVLGGSAVIPEGGVKPYGPDPRYLQIDTQFNLASGEGPRHLTFSMDGDLYVLPAAFRLTRRLAPQIQGIFTAADAAGRRTMQISGTGLSRQTRILFDGVPATVRDFDGAVLTVAPPPLSSTQRAVVVALNPDGQSSLFLQAAAPPTADPEGADPGGITVTPSLLPVGVESAIEIVGFNTSFSADYVTVALGSAGITVKNIWVTGPDRILANVAVSPVAVPGGVTVTVLNGLRMVSLPFGMQVSPSNPRQSFLRGTISDLSTGRASVSPNGAATIQVSGPLADQPASALTVLVGEQRATVVSFSGGILVFRIPGNLPPGPAVVRVSAGSETALPTVLTVDPPPPTIREAQVSGTRVDANRPARPGEVVSLTVAGLGEASADLSSRIGVQVAIFGQRVTSVTSLNGQHVVQFVLDPTMAPGPQSVSVSIDGRSSEPFPLPVRAN